jgi:hypothetical protein
MRTRSLAVVASLAASFLAAPAFAAATYTWQTETGGSPKSGNSTQYIFTSNGETVKVRAYSLDNLTTATFQNAGVGLYDGGLGVTYTGESTSSPQHAIDNNGKYDFLLFEFESDDFTNFKFEIGWKNGTNGDTDIDVYVGNGPANLNLAASSLCSGGASSCNFNDLDDMGFTLAAQIDNVPLNTLQTVGGSLTGRYLLIAGRLSSTDRDDYFKVSVISGTENTRQVPEPSTLAIMAVAAAGAGFVGRRRRQQAT